MKSSTVFGVVFTGIFLTLPVLVQAQPAYFPIATNGVAMSLAFDGTNYLIGIENHQTSPSTIGAQMISDSGNKIGSLISTGRSGISTAVAFDGTNYLLIWEDDGLGTLTNGDTRIYGQFIGTSGTTNGAPFDISGPNAWFDGIKTMAYGGGKYLVTYTQLINPALGEDSTNRYIAGRIVDPNGTVGNEIRISTGYGQESDVAFDGANFFVVWCEDQFDTEIRGRLVTPAGFIGSEVSINASAAPSDNPKSVTFDGTNYLVVWNDAVTTNDLNCLGQRIDTSGSLVGNVITITDEPGSQMVTTVAFDGDNYMAAWIDMQNETNWNMYGQYISPIGSLIDSKITLSTNALNQLGGIGFADGNYLVLVNNGVEMGEGGITQVDNATGAFITPSSGPPPSPFSDDFNDNVVDTNKWSDDIFVDSGTNAALTETNGRLEFTGSTSGTNSTVIIRPWIGSLGSYTQNWEAAVDVNLGTLTLPENSGMEMFLAVIDASDETLGNRIVAELSLDQDFDGQSREYSASPAVGDVELYDVPHYGYITTADTIGRLRIAFDASTKVLAVSYNGNPLSWLDVDEAGTSWGMTADARFSFALGGSMWGNATNSGHAAYADNFEFRTGDQLDYLLTVNNGSGSGTYTNGVGVGIVAATAPAGQVFDKWVGSTQYLSAADSASTTVTMPAQAISITATYKLTGMAIGDDFNDNSVNSNLWGKDVLFDSGTNIVSTETNSRLEFTGSAVGGNDSSLLHPWIGNVGSYTQDWEVAVDAHVGSVALSNQWDDSSLFLAVIKASDALSDNYNDYMSVELYKEWGDNGIERRFEINAGAGANDVLWFEEATAAEQGRLRIAFDASTKILTASFNGMPRASLDVDQVDSQWNMTDASTFMFVIGGNFYGNFSYTGHDVYADNFTTIGSAPTPADWDGNGLPDWWERLYFGVPGVDPNSICANGFNTVQQAYIAGFSPINPESSFGITGINGNQIQWDAVSNRVYTVYWSTNLPDGFLPLQTDYTGGSYTDLLHGAADSCFYKLDVQLQQ